MLASQNFLNLSDINDVVR